MTLPVIPEITNGEFFTAIAQIQEFLCLEDLASAILSLFASLI